MWAQRADHIAELLGRIGERIGRQDLIKLGARATPPGEPPLLVPDTRRLRTELGFEPRWSLDGGLEDTIVGGANVCRAAVWKERRYMSDDPSLAR